MLLVECHPEPFKVRDVSLFVCGDMRDHHPVSMQVRTRDFLDARQRLALDWSEFIEVNLWPGQQVETGTARDRPGRGARGGPGHNTLDMGTDILGGDPSL